MSKKGLLVFFLSASATIFILWLIYMLPPVHDRLAWRIDNLRTAIKYSLNPPSEVVFLPEGQAQSQLASPTLPPSPTPTQTLSPEFPTPTAEPTLAPTITPTQMPVSLRLEGVKYEDQHGRLNYCGPANLSMGMTFWGWDGNRDIAARVVKPLTDDKNVMPYEMAEFVESQSDLKAIVRMGGDIELVKSLVAAGFPVILEKGVFLLDLDGQISWMGHYQLISGYDEARRVLVAQDTYVGPDTEVSYEDVITGWRAFNYLYLVIYAPEREAEVMAVMGPRWDDAYSNQTAAQVASDEIFALSGRDLYFAWFNRGTSLAQLQDYAGAAAAYDEAFVNVYPNIPANERPWRMMWYQTGPYRAYYYTGRHYDVISLASTTLAAMSKPVLEESFYWRALSKEALGDVQGAVSDLRESLNLNPNFSPGKTQLERLQGGG